MPQHTDTPPKPSCASLRTLRYGDVTGRVVTSIMALCLIGVLFALPPSFLLAPCPASPHPRATPRPRRSDAENGCSAVMSPRRARTTGSGLIPHFLPMVAVAFKPSNVIPSYLLIHFFNRELSKYQTNLCLVPRIKVLPKNCLFIVSL